MPAGVFLPRARRGARIGSVDGSTGHLRYDGDMTTPSNAPSNPKVCPATRKDGQPCTAHAGPSGFCVGHSPTAQEARAKGGRKRSFRERLDDRLPGRYAELTTVLRGSIAECYRGELPPSRLSAMAQAARVIMEAYKIGEIGVRLDDLEKAMQGRR